MNEPVDELVDHVDVDGTVIEVVSRARMRAETLRHRCTYVFVVRSDDRLVVHRRAEWKSIYPGHWDLAFGGVCGAGEAWESSARRELAEEAGLDGDDLVLHDLGAVIYDADDGHIVGRAFRCDTDRPVHPVDGEVVEVDEVPLADLEAWLDSRPVATDTRLAALPRLLHH